VKEERPRRRRFGRLASGLSLAVGLAAGVGASLAVVVTLGTVGPAVAAGKGDVVTLAWTLGLIVAAAAAGLTAIVAVVKGGQIGSRVNDLSLAVERMGRSTSAPRVRMSGNDEVTALAHALQVLGTDLALVAEQAQKSSGLLAAQDPQVREMRDRTLPQQFETSAGWEIDGGLGAGTRGGLDWFATARSGGGVVLFVVSAEGASAMAVLAGKLAFDELARAFQAGANARKALSHTNRVLHKQLARGVCCKAMLVEIGEETKLYQAGYRAPLWVCAAGQVQPQTAEGLALGLDEGPVFEKALRSTSLATAPGVRIVLTNEAGVRHEELLGLVQQHSAKNSTAFLNLVLGALEADAGEAGLREDVVLLTGKRIA
jgi:hypothetical protein